jgi:ubiquinone biosynthesis protein Coq4
MVSSSRYLNSAGLRDWVSTHLLRKSHKSLPTPSDMMSMGSLMLEAQDLDAIEELITRERARYPEFDRWLSEGFVSTFERKDLEQYAPNSIGGIFRQYLDDNGFQIDIVPRFEPKSQYQFFLLRSGQIHDFEHIICGGGFNVIGELVPYYMRLANIPKFISPALAAELNAAMILGSSRIFVRTALHYQEAFPMALRAVQHGIEVGQKSGPMFMAKYEDLFHLTVPEARKKLGVDGPEFLDSAKESLAWEEYQ